MSEEKTNLQMEKLKDTSSFDNNLQELLQVIESGGFGTRVISPGSKKQNKATAKPEAVQQTQEAAKPEAGDLEWKRKAVKSNSTTVKCIVIDRNDRWHEAAEVDLHGMDTTQFTWGYYGSSYPVLVEDETGKLSPWYLPDLAGESCDRLYKGANPEGFRNTFKHRSTTLHKIQVGLMVALVAGILFLIYILASG